MKEPTNGQLAKAIKSVQGTVDKLARTMAEYADSTGGVLNDLSKGQQKLQSEVSDLKQGQQKLQSEVSDLKQGQQKLQSEFSDLSITFSRFVTKQDLNDAIALVKNDIMRPVHTHDDMIYAVIDVLKKNKTITQKQAANILSFDFRRA
ncbi:MAG: hypothetical protein AAB886_02200 [Patescibacteria group bacterium]